MDKHDVHKAITSALFDRYETAKWAAKQAHDAATNKESIAENKYDTFGLEASYLAHGQSQRVLECEKDWVMFEKKQPVLFTQGDVIGLWCLIALSEVDSPNARQKYFFISPCAGGLTIQIKEQRIYLVSTATPVGKALLGKMLEDEVELLQNGEQIAYEITMVA